MRVQPGELLHDAERDLLATAEYFVTVNKASTYLRDTAAPLLSAWNSLSFEIMASAAGFWAHYTIILLTYLQHALRIHV